MKKLVILVLMGVLCFSYGCNGGGGNKIDLSGLKGTWDYSEHYVGIITYDDSSTDIDDFTVDDTFTIDTNTIIDNGTGDIVNWTYDGETLTMAFSWSKRNHTDPDCGDYLSSGNYSAVVPVKPGATSANYTGTLKRWFQYVTPYTCYDSVENPTMTGSMTKR